jgi:hypothetical protein
MVIGLNIIVERNEIREGMIHKRENSNNREWRKI